LTLRHPRAGRQLSWEAAPPQDMERLLAALEADRP